MKGLILAVLLMPRPVFAGLVTVYSGTVKPKPDLLSYLMDEVTKIETHLTDLDNKVQTVMNALNNQSLTTALPVTYNTVKVEEIKLSPKAEQELIKSAHPVYHQSYVQEPIVPYQPVVSPTWTQYYGSDFNRYVGSQ